jgi:hypothetical protein
METFGELRQLGFSGLGYARETVDHEDENDRSQLCSLAPERAILHRHVLVTSKAILF